MSSYTAFNNIYSQFIRASFSSWIALISRAVKQDDFHYMSCLVFNFDFYYLSCLASCLIFLTCFLKNKLLVFGLKKLSENRKIQLIFSKMIKNKQETRQISRFFQKYAKNGQITKIFSQKKANFCQIEKTGYLFTFLFFLALSCLV